MPSPQSNADLRVLALPPRPPLSCRCSSGCCRQKERWERLRGHSRSVPRFVDLNRSRAPDDTSRLKSRVGGADICGAVLLFKSLARLQQVTSARASMVYHYGLDLPYERYPAAITCPRSTAADRADSRRFQRVSSSFRSDSRSKGGRREPPLSAEIRCSCSSTPDARLLPNDWSSRGLRRALAPADALRAYLTGSTKRWPAPSNRFNVTDPFAIRRSPHARIWPTAGRHDHRRRHSQRAGAR